ncbi:FAD-dependent oxidoreductase [Spirillospora sp. NPDC049024]
MAKVIEQERVNRRPDVLIVGAGPSGLAAASGLSSTGLSVVIVDQGRQLNLRYAERSSDLASGVGGAGLYSDGKFSFYPSATHLWSLQPAGTLSVAYKKTEKLLATIGMDVPLSPQDARGPVGNAETSLHIKRYPSFYASLEERRHLIKKLLASSDCQLVLNTKVIRVQRDGMRRLIVEMQAGGEGRIVAVTPRHLVLAMGRFGPISLELPGAVTEHVFRRVELGFRIEQSKETFFLRNDPALDPKLIAKSGHGAYSWRTFCCCRDGEIVTTQFDRWTTVSGRADCAPTGRSSIGFNLRLEDAIEAGRVWPLITTLVQAASAVVREPYGDFMMEGTGRAPGPIAQLFGEGVSMRLHEGLRRLAGRYGDRAFTDAMLVGPAIEGVGFYPNVSKNLQLGSYPIWVPGDGAGLFRGITAALVSGFFVSNQIVDAVADSHNEESGK